MHEAVRLVADWLADADSGVSAVLADVPRFTGDAAPTAIAAIYDSARYGWVARGQVPRDDNSVTRPCLLVSVAGPMPTIPSVREAGTAPYHIPGEITLAIQYLHRTVDSEDAARDCSYVLRAIRGSLLLLADEPILIENVDSARQANGVRLMSLTKFESHHGPLAVNDTTVTGLVLATWATRETTPLS